MSELKEEVLEAGAPTLGEFRVGINFNPSGDELVDKIKRASADLIDLIETIPYGEDHRAGAERQALKENAQRAIEDGAMWAVKAATKR
jgi:hypothetical protein